jgi:phage shock protein A
VLLAGAGLSVAGVAACTGPQPTPPDPVATALKALLQAEKSLVASYDQAVAKFGSLTGRVQSVRADHAEHVKALTALLARLDAEPTPSASAQPLAGSVSAGSSSGARQELAALEQKQATAAVALCLSADGDDATLLASLAASENSHVEVLT